MENHLRITAHERRALLEQYRKRASTPFRLFGSIVRWLARQIDEAGAVARGSTDYTTHRCAPIRPKL